MFPAWSRRGRGGTVRSVSTPAVEVLPRRPHAPARAALRASQRGRLLCAIADAVAERGYAATSVADVIARAGVSRKTFYAHFEDKEACFLASYDVGADAIHAALAESAAGLEDWEEVLDAALGTWLAVLASDLAFTRAYMVEVWAAGTPPASGGRSAATAPRACCGRCTHASGRRTRGSPRCRRRRSPRSSAASTGSCSRTCSAATRGR